MQILSRCEIKAVDGGSLLGALHTIFNISYGFVKKILPQKKFPHIIGSDAEIGNGIKQITT